VYYRDSDHIDIEDAGELLRAANKFQFEHLSLICRSTLRLTLDAENAPSLLEKGLAYDARLKQMAMEFIVT
jgi:hypothetical protein